jgi:hypothetical protein
LIFARPGRVTARIAAVGGILGGPLGPQAIKAAGLRLVVIEPVREETVRWIP